MNFITWLSETMEAKHWTQQGLGSLIGVSQVTVGQWLRGRNNPDPAQLSKLAEVSGVDTIWLFQLVGYIPKGEGASGSPAMRPKVIAVLRELETLPDEILDLLADQIKHVLRPRAKRFEEGNERARTETGDTPRNSGDAD